MKIYSGRTAKNNLPAKIQNITRSFIVNVLLKNCDTIITIVTRSCDYCAIGSDRFTIDVIARLMQMHVFIEDR